MSAFRRSGREAQGRAPSPCNAAAQVSIRPLLVTRAVVVNGTIDDSGTVQAWEAWKLVEASRPAPPVEPVWIDDFAIQAALAWEQGVA